MCTYVCTYVHMCTLKRNINTHTTRFNLAVSFSGNSSYAQTTLSCVGLISAVKPQVRSFSFYDTFKYFIGLRISSLTSVSSHPRNYDCSTQVSGGVRKRPIKKHMKPRKTLVSVSLCSFFTVRFLLLLLNIETLIHDITFFSCLANMPNNKTNAFLVFIARLFFTVPSHSLRHFIAVRVNWILNDYKNV